MKNNIVKSTVATLLLLSTLMCLMSSCSTMTAKDYANIAVTYFENLAGKKFLTDSAKIYVKKLSSPIEIGYGEGEDREVEYRNIQAMVCFYGEGKGRETASVVFIDSSNQAVGCYPYLDSSKAYSVAKQQVINSGYSEDDYYFNAVVSITSRNLQQRNKYIPTVDELSSWELVQF